MPTTWTSEDKSQLADGFLQKEDDFYLLLEDGGRIYFEDVQQWTEQVKNTPIFV
jgi:hypothetical protein